MLILDRLTMDGARRRTADGYLAASGHVARSGIQLYGGREVGRADLPRVRVFRPEGEVFDRASLTSLAHKPITIGHPAESVTAETWRKHAAGVVGGEILRDGDRIAVSLLLTDAEAIRALDGGKRELSAGYTCDLDFTAGRTPTGEAYDAVQRRIRFNHVALVERGRAGSEVRIGDSAPATTKELHMMTHDEVRAMRDTVRGMPLKDAAALPIYAEFRGLNRGNMPLSEYYALLDGADGAATVQMAADRARVEASRDQMIHDMGSAYGVAAPHQVGDACAAHAQMCRDLDQAWRHGR